MEQKTYNIVNDRNEYINNIITDINNNIQQKKTYFSVPMGLSHSLTNTICYVSSGLTIFFNASLPSQDSDIYKYNLKNTHIINTNIIEIKQNIEKKIEIEI